MNKKLVRIDGSFFENLEEAEDHLLAAFEDILGMYVYKGYLDRELKNKVDEHVTKIVNDRMRKKRKEKTNERRN